MIQRTSPLLLTIPTAFAPETTPVKYTTHLMTDQFRAKWYNNERHDFLATYRERSWTQTWPAKRFGWEKNDAALLRKTYSPEALKAAVAMIPDGFEVRDVPRPPQRIKAQSEGIVGRWYTNYWTLHSIKYQCQLAGVEWKHGERFRPRTNFEEPYIFVDFEESKAVRDFRSRWMNVNRSLVGMSKKVKEAEQEKRFARYKRRQDKFWTDRKMLIGRVKSMAGQGLLESSNDLPIKTFNMKAFLRDD